MEDACAVWDFSRPQLIADGGLLNRPTLTGASAAPPASAFDLERACAAWDYSRPARLAAPPARAASVYSAQQCGRREHGGVRVALARAAVVDSC